MARLIKVLVVAVILLSLLFVSVLVWVRSYGKSLVEKRASAALNRPVTIEKADIVFPLVLRLNGLNVEGLLWADQAEIKRGLWLWGGMWRLSQVELTRPVLTVHRTPDNQIIWTEHGAPAGAPSAVTAGPSSMTALIDVLVVNDGQIHLPSHASADGESEFSLSGVRLVARNVPLSGQPSDVTFDFWGRIEGEIPFAGDGLKGSGSINWPRRNMDAVFGVVNPQGQVDLDVNLNAKNNDMMVRGRVKTRRMTLKTEAPQETGVEDVVLEAVRSAGLELDMEFSFPTKMDRWELKNIEFSGNLNASDEAKTAEELKRLYEKFGSEEKK